MNHFANREQSNQEARYVSILETSPDAVIEIDRSGIITDWNPAAENIFGYTRALAMGRDATGFILPTNTNNHGQAELTRNLKSGKGRLFGRRTEMMAVRFNGSKFPIELTLSSAPERAPHAFIACVRDISERRLANIILRKSEERFRMLVERVTDYAIHLLDAKGRVLTWNAGVEHIDGYRARDIIGRRFHRLYTEEDIAKGKPEQALVTACADGHYSHEGWSVRKDGSLYWSNVVLTALHYQNGSLFGYSRIGCDHTKRKEAEIESAKLTAVLQSHLRERTIELEAALQLLREAQSR